MAALIRELAFALVLLVSAGSVFLGVSMWSLPLAFVLGGPMLAVIGWLVLRETPDVPVVDALEVET